MVLYEDFFFEEFIPHIEQTFKIQSEKAYRAVAGLLMGGGGALIYALHHPEYFIACSPLSAWFGPSTIEELEKDIQKANMEYTLEDLESYFKHYNALAFIE